MDQPGAANAARIDTATVAAESPPTASPRTAPQPPHGYTPRKDAHLKRLRRIEGQVRGLQRMIDEDKYCIDILTQVSAATRALQAFSLELLDEHLNHCVLHAAEHGGDEAAAKVAEASAAIARLVRS
jgi:DNA-binding FrmR family transcriptional regulator